MLRISTLKAFFCFFIYAASSFASGTDQYKFIENKGQLPANVFYSTKAESGNIYFEKNCLTFDFINAEDGLHQHKEKVLSKNTSSASISKSVPRHTYKMYFEGANVSATLASQQSLETSYNYFYGKDQSKWVSDAKAYRKITYHNIYNHISATYYTSAKNTLKYDFILSPGANYKDIKLRYEGIHSIKLVDCNIVITTSLNQVTEQKPYAYQVIGGRNIQVPCNYILNGNSVSFSFPKGYNKALPLIIDPEVLFSTFSGSVADNFGMCATYDVAGNAYAAGLAFSTGYPVTTGAYQSKFSGGIDSMDIDEIACDIAIMKYSPDGKKLLYATYLGGNGNEYPHSMIVNSKNELVILGNTSSDNFPVTKKSIFTYNRGFFDFFISKLSSDGSDLVASTYFGGTSADGWNKYGRNGEIYLNYNYGDERRSEVKVDKNDNVLFVSCTQSSDMPLFNQMYLNFYGEQDACFAKFNSSLDTMLFSTVFGGKSVDAAYGVTIADDGSYYVCGGTQSDDIQTINFGNEYDLGYGGKTDGFVMHFSEKGRWLKTTYLGNEEYNQAYFIEWKNDKVFVAGQSIGFPVSQNVYSNPKATQFIAILDKDLKSIIKSTVFGSGRSTTVDISLTAFKVDNCENIYVTGWGGEVNQQIGIRGSVKGMPLTKNAFQNNTDGSDFYMAVFAKDFDTLLYGSYLGGSKSKEHTDGGMSRFDNNGMLYLAVCSGCGGYSDFPTSDSALSKINKGKRPGPGINGGCNQVMVKLDLNPYKDFDFSFEAGKSDIQFFGPKALSYSWDFGDGTTSTERNPKRNFQVGKTYNVCLKLKTSCGDKDICKEVKIWNTGMEEISNSQVSVYPNPAQNLVTVKVDRALLSKHFPANLYMADALGRNVISTKITSEVSEIDLLQLKSGIYFYTITSGEKVLATGKLNITK